MNGKMVPLLSVVKPREVTGPYTLTRFNMFQAVTINGSPAKGVSSGDAMKAMADLSNSELPKDMGLLGLEYLYKKLKPADKSVES